MFQFYIIATGSLNSCSAPHTFYIFYSSFMHSLNRIIIEFAGLAQNNGTIGRNWMTLESLLTNLDSCSLELYYYRIKII